MSTITKGEREMVDFLAAYDGIPAVEVEAAERTPEATGYYKGVRALVDAGLRSAWHDNAEEGAIVPDVATQAEIVDALAKHGGFSAEFLADVAGDEGVAGKPGVLAGQAAGYKRACAAMAAAGFRPAWVDDRKQPVGDSHGWIERNDI